MEEGEQGVTWLGCGWRGLLRASLCDSGRWGLVLLSQWFESDGRRVSAPARTLYTGDRRTRVLMVIQCITLPQLCLFPTVSCAASAAASPSATAAAGVPLSTPVAGIAMGLILEPDGSYVVLSDILGAEDALGDMDFKVWGCVRACVCGGVDCVVVCVCGVDCGQVCVGGVALWGHGRRGPVARGVVGPGGSDYICVKGGGCGEGGGAWLCACLM